VARVVATRRLGPHFVRITFGGPELRGFGAAGDDQRIKLLLPRPGRDLSDVPEGPDWRARWRALPDAVRPVMRTYTVRAFRPADAELDVDVVMHGLDGGPSGPMSSWAACARVGDELALVGPDRPGTGSAWGVAWAPPRTAARVLLAGDETAVPALGAILETLSTGLTGVVVAEVPERGDVPSWSVPDGVAVRWLVRGDTGAPRGVLLEQAVGAALTRLGGGAGGPVPLPEDDRSVELLWDVPEPGASDGDLYVWMAGEAGVLRRCRRLARHDHGLPRSAVACMGYWREGVEGA
jgi:NADPH-dependent ferric siderophore reductase